MINQKANRAKAQYLRTHTLPCMLKTKKAFTLAEVLIALVIIGVVAALAIPNLIAFYQEQMQITAWKKAYSNISSSANMLLKDSGGSFIGAFNGFDSMKDAFKSYFIYIKDCPMNTNIGNCWPLNQHAYNYTLVSNGWDLPGIILNDGTLLKFWFGYHSSTCTDGTYYPSGECGIILVDINGFAKPNSFGRDMYVVHILKDHIEPANSTNALVSGGERSSMNLLK